MAYGNSDDYDVLIKAMRDQARQDTGDLKYLTTRSVQIVANLMVAEFIQGPMVFLIPIGSPAETIGESDVSVARRATHTVQVIPGIFTESPYGEDPVIGSGEQLGLIKHTQNVLKFYSGNMLGLTGLDSHNRPKIEVPTGGYQTMQVQEDDEPEGWLLFSACDYEARTLPYDNNTR
jgi:hypothetical protein